MGLQGLRRRPVTIRQLCVLAAALVASVMTVAALGDLYLPGDVEIARAVQSVHLGDAQITSDAVYKSGVAPWLYLLAAAAGGVLLLFRHRLLASFVFVALAAHYLVFAIKILVERPRPSPFLVDVAKHSDGYSFPSGHVMSAVLLWGFVFYASHVIRPRLARLAVQAGSAAMVIGMGFQRVHAGAHWPTDVLAAYLWGGLALFAVIKAFELTRDYRTRSALLLVEQSRLGPKTRRVIA